MAKSGLAQSVQNFKKHKEQDSSSWMAALAPF